MSIRLVTFLCRAKNLPNSGRSNCPRTSGSRSRAQRLNNVSPRSMPPAPVPTTRLTSQGVMKIPMTLDMLALRIAAGTLPPALGAQVEEAQHQQRGHMRAQQLVAGQPDQREHHKGERLNHHV